MMETKKLASQSEQEPAWRFGLRADLLNLRAVTLLLAAGWAMAPCHGFAQDAGASVEAAIAAADSDVKQEEMSIPKALIVLDQDPSDFLEKVSQHTKARWRQQYRTAPPTTPPADRMRAAFGLGGFLADIYLAHQAQDVQQIKNVNQDVLKHANALALGDRMGPIILIENKMAESEDWIALRAKLYQTQEEISDWLHAQRDEDLAAMVTFGIWLRLFQITTCVACSDDEELEDKTVAIGSVDFLKAMHRLYEQTSQKGLEEDKTLNAVGKLLTSLCKSWSEVSEEQPATQELLTSTKEKLDILWSKLSTLK